MDKKHRFSQSVTIFHGIHLPEKDLQLIGYSALIQTFELRVPLPFRLAALGTKYKNYQKDRWFIYSPRYKPDNTLYGQLLFALKHEGIDLHVIKALFDTIPIDEIQHIILLEPTSTYRRRIWFLFEWLKKITLDIPDAAKSSYIDLLNPTLQYPGPKRPSKRHRINNNLPGTPDFCPLVRRTENLENFMHMHLSEKAQCTIGLIHSDILTRAAAFLLLKDTKASFEIEGEKPSANRAERWGRALSQAGSHPLSRDEFYRLQEIVINDFRFLQPGYRNEGGFIGDHDRTTQVPIPVHISARWQDLPKLMDGLIATDNLLKSSHFDAVLASAMIAFGFVFIHPFADGNGRIHRYLLHHVLAEKNFAPKGIIFPIAAVILEHLDQYQKVLEAYSKPRLSLMEWQPTAKGNVEVLNDTADFYRYFDATAQAEFIYECIKETIEVTLPAEISYLQHYDEMKKFINNYFDMPKRLIDLLILFLRRGNGQFSKRALREEFSSLTQDEIEMLEEKYLEIFDEEQ